LSWDLGRRTPRWRANTNDIQRKGPARTGPTLWLSAIWFWRPARPGNRSDDQQPDSELPSPPTAFDPFDPLAVFRGKLVPLREPGAQQFSDLLSLKGGRKPRPCWSVVGPS